MAAAVIAGSDLAYAVLAVAAVLIGGLWNRGSGGGKGGRGGRGGGKGGRK